MDSSRDVDVRRDFQCAAHGFLETLPSITDQDWDRPALGVWTVRDLTGHTSRALATVQSYLDPTRRVSRPDLVDAADYLRAARAALADPAAVAERGRQAGRALGAEPTTAVQALAAQVLALVAQSADDALVTTPVGTMTLRGYLPTRTFELVVHTFDLAAAIEAPPPAPLREALPACLRLATAVAAQREDARDLILALTGRRPLPPGYSIL